MKKIKTEINNSKKIYHSILASILIGLAISISFTTLFITNKYQNIYLEKIKETESNRLNQASQTSNFMTEYGMNLALQIYFDPFLNEVMFLNGENIGNIQKALARLNYIRLSTSFIDSIYIYNEVNQKYIISSSLSNAKIQTKDVFHDQNINEIINQSAKGSSYFIYNKTALFLPRKYQYFDNGFTKEKMVYTLVYNNLSKKNESSAVIINISPQWFEEILFNNMNLPSKKQNEATEIFAIDSNNNVVINNKYYDIMEDLSEEEWIKKIKQANKNSGYIVEEVDNEQMLINYYKSKNLETNWIFVSFKPYHYLTKEIESLRKNVIIFSFILLIVALSIEIIISRRIYSPISKLLSILETSKLGKEDYKVTLKNNFIRLYLQNKRLLTQAEIKEKFEKYQINLSNNENFLMILMKIDNYETIRDNNLTSINAIKYNILNNLSEALGRKEYNHEVVILQHKYCLIICNVNEQKQNIEVLTNTLSDKKEEVKQKYNIIFSLFTSNIESEFLNIPNIYNNLINMAKKSFVYGENIDLSLKDFNEIETTKFLCPKKQVKDLINALKNEQEYSVCKKSYDVIIDILKRQSHKSLKCCLTRVILEISEVVDYLKEYKDFSQIVDTESLLVDIEYIEDYQSLNNRFYEIFQQISNNKNRNTGKNEQLVNKINEVVNINYSNHLFSIADIATEMNLSPGYLGRIYKKSAGQSLNDYIKEVRLNKSIELLLTSDQSVSDIAVLTGFSTGQYYHIVFKKKVGVTPLEFRKANMRKDKL